MLLVVPGPDPEPFPTLGPQVCDLIEDRFVFGPGSVEGQPYRIDPEFRAFIYRGFEVFPPVATKAFAGAGPALHVRDRHQHAGLRRFRRLGLSVRKGLAKTEKLAILCGVVLHPEGPVVCDGFDADGNPVGRPAVAPYIGMLATGLEQVEELGYGALKFMLEEGPDADLFDVTLERAVRLDERGREAGKAVPLANAPDQRDGARTVLNAFDEPHRLTLPRQHKAHNTMQANLPKRPLEQPFSIYVGTAGELGEGSVAENLHAEAERIHRGQITAHDLFYVYRTDDDPKRDLSDRQERLRAIAEATGPAGEWGPGQFDHIASQWDVVGADKGYLERTWLNRWVKGGVQAFDTKRWAQLCHLEGDPAQGLRPRIPKGALVTVGFDGARRRDATGLVITDVITGTQELAAGWEKQLDDGDDWEVPEDEVDQAVDAVFDRYDVWKMGGDPPYWTTEMGVWAGRHQGKVEEWWTNRHKVTAYAVRGYIEAMDAGAVGWSEKDPDAEDLSRHVANAGRKNLPRVLDDNGNQMFILAKIHPDRKFDYSMAAVISWDMRMQAVKAGATKPRRRSRPRRIR